MSSDGHVGTRTTAKTGTKLWARADNGPITNSVYRIFDPMTASLGGRADHFGRSVLDPEVGPFLDLSA
jgi:hypothetical protein